MDYLDHNIDAANNSGDKADLKTAKNQIKDNEHAVIKLAKEIIKKYKNTFASKPWAEPKSIVGLASDGYAFGSEDGQIKNLSDHNNILPLYDYGLDVYDFDMSKVKPIADLAKLKAEEDIFKYFNTP